MPQPKWYHKSLAELCMNSIVDNKEKWTASRGSVQVSSLFKLLPSHCLDNITECLLKDHRLRKSQWSKDYAITEDMLDLLLLSPHRKVLDLSQDYQGTGHDLQRNLRIFRLASVNCLQLTTLKINDGGYYFPFSDSNRNFEVEETFACILQLFEHLQILDLSGTIYGARSMLKLGSTNKPKIRELLVDGCPGVTDTVVEVFCKGQSSLHTLSILKTEVTPIGIQIAIKHLPELKEIRCYNKSDVLKAFRRIRKEESRESKKYSLIKLNMENVVLTPPHKVPYKKGSVSLMVDMCPLIVEVLLFVSDEEFTNEELLDFRQLQQLKNLGIRRSLVSSFSIRGGVIPLLQARGPKLEELALLMEVTSEEVCTIIECCPNIRLLRLVIKSSDLDTPEPVVDDRVHSSLCSPKQVIPLRMLETISLNSNLPFYHNAIFVISRKLLLFLLSSPALKEIFIEKCFTLDDQMIEEACTKNSFKYLKLIMFHGCSNVSQKGIDFFLNETNPLDTISVQNCGNVNFDRLKMMVEQKHWHLQCED
ncbi:uncharacterized protein LOC124207192 [Daphnia pulex]|uniref:uncharacterized protein LOC124207192 n=1 Tax=Daphnia pulex TaxID=6669 RepID=UPI001EDDA2BB|nr:uncharacterized protein LOC124207192 [Daphnia pulex]